MTQNKKQTKLSLLLALILLLFILIISTIAKNNLKNTKLITIQPSTNNSDIKLTPEYQRSAERILLTISSKGADENFEKLLERTYGKLLEKFPAYTIFEIVVSENNFPIVERLVKNKQLDQRVAYHKVKDTAIEPWAQDYFEPVFSKDNSLVFLLSGRYLKTKPSRAYKNFTERNDARIFLISQTMGIQNTVQLPFFFEGGNVMIAQDPASQNQLVLIDYTNIADSFLKKNADPAKIAASISQNFGAAKIAVIGNTQRKTNFIHLDQSILPLPNNVIFVNKIIGFPKSSAANQHKTYKKQLEQLGFSIIEIETSNNDVKKSRSSLNAIPFFDKKANKEKVIYPVFEDEIKNDNQTLSKENLKGKALQMYERLEKLDIQPIPLLDQDLYQNNAGYHCIVNVLE